MASLDDMLSCHKSGVVQLSLLATAQRRISGTVTTAVATSQTLVITGPGRLVRYSVLVKGSAQGTINNANSTGSAAATNAMTVTRDDAEGVYECGLEFTNGLVITPGSGQSICVTYTPGNWT